MRTEANQPVLYFLKTLDPSGSPVAGSQEILVNDLLGKTIRLTFSGNIFCVSCGKKTKKTFSDGYCYPCSQKLASCDFCQTRPELCHFDRGTCREPEWAKENCFIPHTVYLANSSGLKVGITRTRQEVHRWMDQGATEAIAIAEVGSRADAGKAEVALKELFADKTNWRAMLSGPATPLPLIEEKEKALASWPEDLAVSRSRDNAIFRLSYPVESYLKKINSITAEKNPSVAGQLLGVKGQYLILDAGVVNIRRHSGYEMGLQVH